MARKYFLLVVFNILVFPTLAVVRDCQDSTVWVGIPPTHLSGSHLDPLLMLCQTPWPATFGPPRPGPGRPHTSLHHIMYAPFILFERMFSFVLKLVHKPQKMIDPPSAGKPVNLLLYSEGNAGFLFIPIFGIKKQCFPLFEQWKAIITCYASPKSTGVCFQKADPGSGGI